MTDPSIPDTQSGSTLQPPTLDIDHYRQGLADTELSEEAQREILSFLWELARSVVDAGFGLDAASMVLGAATRQLFAEAAEHTTADEDDNDERKPE
ncbi:MAG: hypothetical protein AB7E72_01640 [Lysobacterales bacterium]